MEGNPVWVMGQDTIENPEPLDPLLLVSDAGAVRLAALQDGSGVTIARKNFSSHTMVYAAVPLHRSAVFRALFQKAGCVVMNNTPDATFSSANFIVLHTGTGGKRLLRLKNGITLELELPKIATLLFDARTGEEVLSKD